MFLKLNLYYNTQCVDFVQTIEEQKDTHQKTKTGQFSSLLAVK